MFAKLPPFIIYANFTHSQPFLKGFHCFCHACSAYIYFRVSAVIAISEISYKLVGMSVMPSAYLQRRSSRILSTQLFKHSEVMREISATFCIL